LRVLRFLLILFLFLLLGSVAYHHYLYVIDVTSDSIFVSRNEFSGKQLSYSLLIEGKDPRFYSMIIYAFLSVSLTTSIVRFIFYKNLEFAYYTAVIMIGGYALGSAIYLLAYLTGFVDFGFHVFQKLKNALSSGFAVLFFIPFYKYLNDSQSSDV